MSLVAVAELAHPDLALTPTIRATDASIQVVSHTATDAETGMFFFLVESDSFPEFEAALEADHTVSESLIVAEAETTRIYRLGHSDGTKLLSPTVTEMGGLMLEADSTADGWSVRMQLPDRKTLSSLWEYCDEEDIGFELGHIYTLDDFSIDGVGLTDAQRDALVTAYEAGYFEEPRDTSLEELAGELDISPTAVGGRIRRGTARLIEQTLLDDS
ncbi:Predicted DNA binding protein, contains HTH domain [Haloplanus vescus]|uniref:Predicted DNA binding protein, contains HTH domain n=1 Tax=Haloplanus vescus TaxID=555874 RepID=A0A1H3Y3Y5_9EURY|nr:helix-turn-helix domain-containing protein [Haloplanus vescus]SEA05554.1 Predicted DNA binding protein, contains HTH domain [Haloplanus vescus]